VTSYLIPKDQLSIKDQFKLLVNFFEQEKIEYAVIGAFALYAYGYTRTTSDVDFITKIEYQERIVAYLESLGFETLNRSEGFSNHLHPIGELRIDVVYVAGETANIIFESTKNRFVFEDLELPVTSPEHLIALKLFAIQNDPGRKYRELADIKEIFRLTNLDREIVQYLFVKYGLKEYCDEITGKENKD
jgi:hypothetical protein